jgi:hypothetical protein
LNKVKNGADLFVSMDNCYLRWFNEVTGLDVFQRRAYNGSGLIEIEGNKIESHAKYEYICDNVDGEIITKNQNGNPVFVCHKLGNGRVYSYLAPLEFLCMSDGNFTKTNNYCVYKYLRDNMKNDKVAKCNRSEVGLTEHILNNNERILVLINYTSEKTFSQQTFYFLCICHIGALVLGDITIFCASGAKMSFACCHFMERRVKIGDMTLWFYEVYFIKNQ